MSKLIMEFPLDGPNVVLSDGVLTVSLGNGVTLRTNVPDWVQWVNTAELSLVLDIEGNPPHAQPGPAPVE